MSAVAPGSRPEAEKPMIAPEVRKELQRLELALTSRDPTGIDGGLSSLIADDLLEFGKSGRVWTAASVREVLEGAPPEPVVIEEFEVAELAEGVVLVTYVMPGPPAVNRSSIWVRRSGRWVVRFHQGTLRPTR
jgi:glyoxylase I family protein